MNGRGLPAVLFPAQMADLTASGTEAYLHGKPCPYCGHVRTPDKPGPRWHCPSCQNAYPEPDSRPDAGSRPEARLASSTYALIAANVLTIAAALWFDMRLKELFLVYWLQCVMIGIAFVVRLVF